MMHAANLLLLVSFVAPAMSTATKPCGTWNSDLSIEANHIKTVRSNDKHWCKKECMKVDACTAVSFENSTKQCKLYKLDQDSMFHKDKGTQAFVFCGDCNKFEDKTAFGGHDIMTINIKDAWWCRKKCMLDSECNAITWYAAKKECTLKTVTPGFKRSSKNGYKSYLFCDSFGALPICEVGDIVADGVCDSAPCGEKDQHFCSEQPQCKAGLSESSSGKCECGNMWQKCCDGACEDNLACDLNGDKYGQCAPCGGDKENPYGMCCQGNKCNQYEDSRRICLSNNSCAPCGGMWQAPCDDAPACDGMLMPDMHHGKQCVMAGSD